MKALTRNWNFFRLLRLLLGLTMIIQAFDTRDILPGIAGIIFSAMALYNVGCCSTGYCNSESYEPTKDVTDIKYEEIQ